MIDVPAPFGLLGTTEVAILAILVGIFGVGRLGRIMTYDDFPPAVWWRIQWAKITKDGPWTKLFTCYWCLTPWIAAVAIGWYWLGYYVPVIGLLWWIFWGWLAIAYAAAILINHDEKD